MKCCVVHRGMLHTKQRQGFPTYRPSIHITRYRQVRTPVRDSEYSVLALQSASTARRDIRRVRSSVSRRCRALCSNTVTCSGSGLGYLFPRARCSASYSIVATACRCSIGLLPNLAKQLLRTSNLRSPSSSRSTVVMCVRFRFTTLASHRAQSSIHLCSYDVTMARPLIDARHAFLPMPYMATRASPWNFSSAVRMLRTLGTIASPYSTTGRRKVVKIIRLVRSPNPLPLKPTDRQKLSCRRPFSIILPKWRYQSAPPSPNHTPRYLNCVQLGTGSP